MARAGFQIKPEPSWIPADLLGINTATKRASDISTWITAYTSESSTWMHTSEQRAETSGASQPADVHR
jgi:hypothetical protein